MFLYPTFYYNDNADGGAGGATETQQGEGTNNPSTTTETPKPIFSETELKDFGFDSSDALKEFLKRNKENNAPDAEKEKKANLEKANFLKYAVENDLMKPDEFSTYESHKGKQDRDLVFNKYATEYKEDNPDASEEEIKESFEDEYKLSSENEKAKNRGLSRLTKEAKEIRSPFESSYNTAKTRYDEENNLREKIPHYNSFIDEQIKANTPDKMVVFKTKDGESEIEIDVELTKEDRDELAKIFKTPKTFHAFTSGKQDELQKSLSKKINGFLREKYADKISQKIYETAHGLGTRKGSNIGAENPFGLTAGKTKAEAPIIDLEESNRKIAEARARYRQ